MKKWLARLSFIMGIGGLALFVCISLFSVDAFSGSKDKDRHHDKDKLPEHPELHFKWKHVNLESAKDFIVNNDIRAVVFVDKNGGFYIADKNGQEFYGWKKRDGTSISGHSSLLTKNAKGKVSITDWNQLTVFVVEASPGCIPISAGGYSLPPVCN